MALKTNVFQSAAHAVVLVTLTAGLCAQSPTGAPAQAPPVVAQERPTFRVQIDLVSTDVIPRDDKGNFVADLSKDDFDLFEDGVKQELSSMVMSHGGRVTNVLAPPASAVVEGIILPPRRAVNDVSGRIFVFFVDDLHLQFGSTSRVRQLFTKMSKSLLHEGDMFGIVSTGTSSISVQMTYDRNRLDEAINKMTGGELKPEDIINGPNSSQGPTEVRYRAHVAFSTLEELLVNLDKVHNRRKALVYVSDGYDFNPFQDARLGLMDPSSPFLQNKFQRDMNASAIDQGSTLSDIQNDPTNMQAKQGEEFADADLAAELGEVTRQANRSNVSIYTIDPRGLVGMPDLDQQVDPQQWGDFIRKSQDSLRVLAEDTGGVAVVNQNDFDKAIKRIDAETSDYYVLGYYSNNMDVTRRKRKLEVRVKRPGVTTWNRQEYVLATVPVAPSQPAGGQPPSTQPSTQPVMPAAKQP
jgi:VWFA-related protein